ncbi:MAG: aldo/keto reductase [Capsulimonadaceae bacterium]
MRVRQIGSTGIAAHEVGLGSWQLGSEAWGVEADGRRIVEAALECGCNFFDTAPGYAGGRSEEILGEALSGRRDGVVLCSKFGHTAEGESDFRAEQIAPALEQSLRRLRTDRLDILLLHNPPAEMLDSARVPHYDVLEQLRNSGKLRAYGVSVDWGREVKQVLSSTPSQVIEILFHAFHQDALALFEQARAQGVGLVAKVPLDSGWLSGKYGADSRFTGIRGRWSPAVIERRTALVADFNALLPAGLPTLEAALQYVLAQPQVGVVIPGAKSVDQVRRNMAAANFPLSPDVAAAILTLWESKIKDDPLPW